MPEPAGSHDPAGLHAQVAESQVMESVLSGQGLAEPVEAAGPPAAADGRAWQADAQLPQLDP